MKMTSTLDDGTSLTQETIPNEKSVIVSSAEDVYHHSNAFLAAKVPYPASEIRQQIPSLASEIENGENVPKSRGPTPPFQGLGLKERPQRSSASMQPTVMEESDANMLEESISVPQKMAIPLVEAPVAAVCASTSESIPPRPVSVPSPTSFKSSPQDPTQLPNPNISALSLHEALVAPAPKASVSFIQPVIVQHLPGSYDRDVAVPMISSPGSEGRSYHTYLPKARSPLTSPPLSPILHQYTGCPPYQPAPLPYPYPPPPPSMGTPPYQPGFYLAPFMSPNGPFDQLDNIPRAGSAGAEDERTRLLEKVSNVLPDINRLLHHYQETQGLLSEKDDFVRQVEMQHEEEITRLRIELSATKEEYEKIIGEQASENLKLKSEISEHSEKIVYLEELSRESATMKEELVDLQVKHNLLGGQVDSGRLLEEQLINEKKALENELANLRNELSNGRTQHDREIGALKQEHQRQLAEKGDDYSRSLNDQKIGLSKIQLDLAGMITKHAQQKKELEFARAAILEQEHSLTSYKKEAADVLNLHQKDLHAWTRATGEKAQQHKQEMSTLSQQLRDSRAQNQAEVETLRKAHETEIQQFQETIEDLQSTLSGESERQQAQIQTELAAARSAARTLQNNISKERDAQVSLKAELAAEREAHETLRSHHTNSNQHHAELAESMLSLRNKHAEGQREIERIERILHILGNPSPRKITPN